MYERIDMVVAYTTDCFSMILKKIRTLFLSYSLINRYNVI